MSHHPHGSRLASLALQFTTRDLRNRYLGSLSGLVWAVVQPLLLLATYAIVFVEVLKVRLPDAVGAGFVPYLALGLWPWTAFAEGLVRGSNAIVEHTSMLSKIAVPKLLIVFAPVAGSFLIHGVGFLMVLAALDLSQVPIQWQGLPVALLLYLCLFLWTLGLAWMLSALTVFVRDLAHVIPQVLTLGFFLTPVFFAREMIPPRFALLTDANPMSVYLDGFRAAMLGTQGLGDRAWLALAAALAALALGLVLFRRLDRHLEDFL